MWPFPKKTVKPPPGKIEQTCPVTGFGQLSLEKFRAVEGNVTAFRQWRLSPLGRDVTAVLNTHIPYGFPLRGDAVTDTQAAIELGRYQGYLDCLNVFRNLGIFPAKLPEAVEADFGAQEFIEDQKLTEPTT